MTIHQCDKCKKEISIVQKRVFSHRIHFSEGFFDFYTIQNHLITTKDMNSAKIAPRNL